MQQYFGTNKDKNVINLNSKDFNHVKNVMRMKKGDKVFIVFEGVRYIGIINDDLKSVVIDSEVSKETSNIDITVYLPFLNDDKMSLIFQKGTELGVTKFIPVEFERCKYKLDKNGKSKKLDRWNKIIVEAAEQSYRNDVPELGEFINSGDIKSVKGMNILCSLDTVNVKSINEVLNANNICDKITLVFGPEGGLSSAEENIIEKNGYQKVSLGSNVLRTETVPLYVISIIKYLKGCE